MDNDQERKTRIKKENDKEGRERSDTDQVDPRGLNWKAASFETPLPEEGAGILGGGGWTEEEEEE